MTPQQTELEVTGIDDPMTVIDFDARRRQRDENLVPHSSGEAICAHCKHEWVAVIPTAATQVGFECPKCSTHKGSFKHFSVPGDRQVFGCPECGNNLVTVEPNGRLNCCNCGTTAFPFGHLGD